VDANALIHHFADRGIRLWFDGGKIVVEPASRLTQSDREAIRRWKPALLDVLKGDVEGNLDPALIAAAVESSKRSHCLDHMALSRFARIAVEVNRILAELPAGPRSDAVMLASRIWMSAADLLRRSCYLNAYQLLDELPAKVKSFLPQ
jgi:hypothetical protein